MKRNLLHVVACLLVCATSAFAQFPFYEAFDNNNQKWFGVNETKDGYSMTVANGHLVFQTGETAVQTFKYLDFDGSKDFSINAKMVFLGGDNTDLCAIRWGMSDDGSKYYVFGYADKGEYFVGKMDGKLKSMANFLPAPSVKQKDYNSLQVVKEGEQFIFKINNVEVYRAKKMPWFGNGLAVKCPSGSRMMVDYISITDPVKDKALSNNINNILFGGTTPAKNPPKKTKPEPEAAVVAPAITGSQDFKDFMQSFEQLDFPKKFHPREKKLKGPDITDLAYTKSIFKEPNKTVMALAKVSDCAEGFMLLVAVKEKNPQAENTDFVLQKVSAAGVSMGSQKIGRLEYMNNRYFLTTDLDFYKIGNMVAIEVFKYYDAERKENRKISFNQNFCTF